jgi:di/tricarboxylate transporter
VADSTITFLVLGGAVVLFMSNRLPVAMVAVAVSLSLWATGILQLDTALAGFGDPTVIFIACTFIVADGLESSGVTAWVGQQLMARAGAGRTRVLTSVMVVCALATALITPNASVAALIPVVVVIAVRLRRPASQFLMPLAFGAHAGALLALTGSPVNVLVAEAAAGVGVGRFSVFEFAVVGVPLLVGTVAIAVTLGPRLIAERAPKTIPPDFSRLATTLVEDYRVDAAQAGSLYDERYGVAELVVPPRSGLIGQVAFPGMITESGDLVILGIQRDGEDLGPGEVTLAPGDSLLVRGTWQALARQLPDGDVLVVNEPTAVRRQVVPLGLGARESLVVLAGMIVLLATGVVPPAVATLLAAGSLVLLKVLTIDQAYRAVSWTTVILVAGMIPMSTAMQQTGAAAELADLLVDVVGDAGPHALLIGLFALVAVLGQLISNTATALIVIPIAVTSASELGISAKPVLMAVNIAAAAALLTPVATPANLMVMEPAGYRFGDYWKFGLPILLWFGLIAVLFVPMVWRF